MAAARCRARTSDAPLALSKAVGSNIVTCGPTLGVAATAAPLVIRMRLLSPMLMLV